MTRYIAFLRGINVGGQKKVPMAELREVLSETGLKSIQTYIQSGNIVLESENHSKKDLQESIEKVIDDHFGFHVPVLVKSVIDIKHILENNPFNNKEDLESNRIYFVLLFQKPSDEKIILFKEEHYPKEKWQIVGDCLYLCCENGYGKAKLNNNVVERKLKVDATTRNHKTMEKLLELGTF